MSELDKESGSMDREKEKEKKVKERNRIRRAGVILLMAVLVFSMTGTAWAANGEATYDFIMTGNGGSSATVKVGDTIHFTVSLKQKGSDRTMTMYAVNDVLRYNSDMFQLAEKSLTSSCGTVTQKDLTGEWAGWSELRFNVWSSEKDGESWNNPTVLMEADFVAKAVGTASFLQQNAEMAKTNGIDSYESVSNNVGVLVKANDSATGQNTGGGGGGGGSAVPASEKTPDVTESPSGTTTEPVKNTEKQTFSDVAENAWYAKAVDYVVEASLFNGTGNGMFSPDANMTRAMLVTVLHRLAGAPKPESTAAFQDVAAGQWYTDAIAWASETGIVSGYSAVRFGTNDSVTREQLAAILYRYAMQTGSYASEGGVISGFQDAGAVSGWAKEAVSWAIAKGIITGISADMLAPAGTATRAQVATMLMRFSQQ